MKKLFPLFMLVLFALNINAAVKSSWADDFKNQPEVKAALTPEMVQLGLEDFLALTPKKYKEMTGEKLGLKKTLELKAAQKMVKKQMNKDPQFSKGIYILLAFLGWAWLAMGIMDDWEGKNWVVNLILTFLTCGIGGLIHALVKMKEYY